MSTKTPLAFALTLVACAACSGGTPQEAKAPPAAAPTVAPSHGEDCKTLVSRLDQLERESEKTQDQERGDLSLRDALRTAEQGAAALDALPLRDAVARRLSGDYAKHIRDKGALMQELLPVLERYSTAVLAAKQAEAGMEANLAECKQQKKLSKACESKIAAATDQEVEHRAKVGAAHAEVRKTLESPGLKERDTRLSVRDQELALQLHEQCGGPKPVPAE